LGRDHDGAEAKRALGMATAIFPSVSLDIIYGWTGQTEALLNTDLDVALSSGAQHISAYQLTMHSFRKGRSAGRYQSGGCG